MTDDLVSKIEELERELEIRGGVLELHRIRVAELEGAERQRDELLAALEKITDPIKAMRDALPEGAQLNGMMAAQLSESPAYLKELARAAIAKAKEQGK